MASWRPRTKKQYKTHIQRWFSYCDKQPVTQVNSISPSIQQVIQFLTEQFNNGLVTVP